ncbi:MAG: GAF domain-containing protein [Muribaculaceae bacterium]|nr:GAF domain-containing protein [Muribaculaceae bacterium]
MEDKEKKYLLLERQVASLIDGETNAIGIMANVAALLHHEMGWWWTGFYLVDGDELHLGPFQGPVACFTIKRGRGVCGTAWAEGRTVVVPDVELFPGHIACSDRSRSEIVVPMRDSGGNVFAVLDIDSRELATFDHIDARYLEAIVAQVAKAIKD